MTGPFWKCFLSAAFFLIIQSVPGLSASKSETLQIIKDLASESPERQFQAKQELRSYNFKDASSALENFSNDPNPQMRILMAQTIGELGGIESSKILKKFFKKEKDTTVRRAILLQLAGVLPDDRESGDFFLKAALKDEDPDIRMLALTQASLLSRTDAAGRDLKEACYKVLQKDDFRAVQIIAAIILREFGVKGKKLSRLVWIGLKNPAVEVRRRAAAVLGEIRAEDSLDNLETAARDPDPEVRGNLCKSLSESRDRKTVPILVTLALDSESQVRKDSLSALSSFSKEDATLDPFFAALKDRDPSVRLIAVGALERYNDPLAVPALEKVSLEDPDPGVRTLAKKALITLRSEKTP